MVDNDKLAADGLAVEGFAEGLTPQQTTAFNTLYAFLTGKTDHSMAVLGGFAGSGKTFLVSRLILALQDKYIPVAVAAPTNKAVRVLREKIIDAGLELGDDINEEPTDNHFEKNKKKSGWISFGSIHSLLGLQLSEREDGSQECKSAREPSIHEYQVVIIDECSMIGADLFHRIRASKRTTRVLFVGDPAQLPPIEPRENISPTFSKVMLQVMLSDVVRQAADNPIIKLSMLLRKFIESESRADCASISSVLPPLNEHPAAAMVVGGSNTIVQFALYEIKAGRDARILAFTNATVLAYNKTIHEALHGFGEFPFAVGEPVIMHSQCDARVCEEDGTPGVVKATLITSEEAVIREIRDGNHPMWPNIRASIVILERDGGSMVAVYVPYVQAEIDYAVDAQFAEWRKLKAESNEAFNRGDRYLGRECHEKAKEASSRAWMLRKSFAPLRHAYALTSHKSQGSTFDTAIVDLNDMAKMRSAFQFNRGLYVAATRPRQYLAIVA